MQNVIFSAKKNMSMGLLIVFSLLLYVLSGFIHTAQAEERWIDKSSQFDIKLLNPIRSRRFTYALSPVELANLGETLTGIHRLVITSLWPENIIIEGAELDQDGTLFLPVNDEIVNGSTTKITLKFLDGYGHSFGYQLQVQQLDTSVALPTSPADIAPVLNPTKVVNLKDAVEFLYTGGNPIQTGVNADDISAKRVAVVRGQVLNKDNTPLSGVTISIKGHTEYGQTFSRANGWFDMAFNGGGYVTINYTKDGYLPLQRQLNTPWRDFVISEDVVMISLDPQVTSIDLTSTQDIQVAQGSVQTDADGDRQATLFFPKGTSATMVMPNGSIQSLTTLNVRATEYTVGENGRNAMPGELPPFSGYTYAVDLSVDEAISAGAMRVNFNQEIPVYVDNFLEFPTGEVVPLGWYDYNLSAWIPSKNGRIVEILSITNGLADLDVEGNGDIAKQVALDELGIGENELRQLASTFTTGKALWRMPITHFTPWDGNWPHALPADAIEPIDKVPESTDEYVPEDDEEEECDGCIINAQSQVLGEILPITGSSISMHYQSDRVSGYKAGNILNIPLTGDSVPSSLLGIVVYIQIEGRRFKYNFSALPNQSYTFTWDGYRGYGGALDSGIAKVYVGYIYPIVYCPPAVNDDKSFNKVGTTNCEQEGVRPRSSVRTSTIFKNWVKNLKAPSYKSSLITRVTNMGTWSLSNMHVYDSKSNELFLGTGNKITAKKINNREVYKVAGNSNTGYGNGGFSGDGHQAINAGLNKPTSVNIADNGDIYFVDDQGTRIRKVTEDGVVTTIAGTGEEGFSGDGGLAVNAQLNIESGRILIHDSEIFIADVRNHRIRKISADGIINTVAGNRVIEPPCEFDCGLQVAPMKTMKKGSPQVLNTRSLATETDLRYPKDVKIAKDGTIFIVESTRIRTINPEGIITTIAGNGSYGFTPDGAMATNENLSSMREVLILEDGSFYFSDDYRGLIRRVGVDGVLTTIAGGGSELNINGINALSAQLSKPRNLALDKAGNVYFSINHRQVYQLSNDGIIRLVAGDKSSGFNGNGLAIGTKFGSISDIAVGADNDIYIADSANHRIRRIGNFFPSYSTGTDTAIPAGSGNELYFFSHNGHHLKTVDAITNAELYSFNYTDEGYLNSITDVDGKVLSIERDSSNNSTAIISTNGQRTEVFIDGNGYLTRVVNPVGEVDEFTYSAEGLMTSYIKPKGESNTYRYDGVGRLQQDIEPTGGGWLVEHFSADESIGEKGYQVKMTSGEGRSHQFQVTPLSTGEMKKLNTSPDGSVTEEFFSSKGINITTYPNSNVLKVQREADPRFGMLASSLKLSTLTTPNGLINSVMASKSVVLESDDDLLSHSSLTNMTTINGNTHISQYVTATKTWTSTSPEGRVSTSVLDDKGRSIDTAVNNLASTNFTYNTQGRVANITEGSGVDSRKTNLAYYNSGALQGFLESITDAANRETSFSYDNAGRLLTQTLPNGSDINFNYDANGNITAITPANNETHSFDYTKVDRTSDYTPPDVAEISQVSTQYSYNLDKQLELITLPNGQEVDYIYHATKGHKIQTIIPRGNFDFAYNATTGQIKQVIAPDGGKIEFTYDGSLVLSAKLTGTVSGKVNQVYNNDFQVTQRCVNTSNCIGFSYDNDLLLTQAGSLSITRTVQKGGLISSTSLGTISTSSNYNDFGELLSVSTNDSNVYSVDYNRDNLGRIIKKIEIIQGVITTFDYNYDLLGQLSTVKTNDVLTSRFSFDDNANRTHMNDVAAATFDAQDRLKQHLTNSENNQYLYTDNGDLVSKKNTATNKLSLYHYDVLGNLISAAIPDDNSTTTTQVEYIIDAQNRRIGKKVNNTLIQGFLYKDQLNPIAELDGNGDIVSRFIYGSRAFVPDYMVKGGKTYRIISDHLGSPRLVINTSDSIIAQRLDYDVWGKITLDTNSGFQPFGFAGGLYDQHTRFTRFGARDYDADIGRWTTKDPIGLNGGLNVYGYVGGDPVNGIDPEGKEVVNALACLAFVEGVGFASTANDLNNIANDAKMNLNHLKDIATNRINECVAKGDLQGARDYLDIKASIDKQLALEALSSAPSSPLTSGLGIVAVGSACAILTVTPGL
ncbi:hypothetical protein H4J46_09895 [Colwellia sp. MB02u-6]|uniref:NHL domain-containing protein n=1 Tax=Colwellia sp. MB02u-6 TaxID=2759824 RepID=UPI0015F665E1|nr:RHS repeat-associated core domain-containing protein [Colwellia sp. MB02u-6]MBA6328246.1 hypothetical protein [Colwellia sp. MB02u-6]